MLLMLYGKEQKEFVFSSSVFLAAEKVRRDCILRAFIYIIPLILHAEAEHEDGGFPTISSANLVEMALNVIHKRCKAALCSGVLQCKEQEKSGGRGKAKEAPKDGDLHRSMETSAGI